MSLSVAVAIYGLFAWLDSPKAPRSWRAPEVEGREELTVAMNRALDNLGLASKHAGGDGKQAEARIIAELGDGDFDAPIAAHLAFAGEILAALDGATRDMRAAHEARARRGKPTDRTRLDALDALRASLVPFMATLRELPADYPRQERRAAVSMPEPVIVSHPTYDLDENEEWQGDECPCCGEPVVVTPCADPSACDSTVRFGAHEHVGCATLGPGGTRWLLDDTEVSPAMDADGDGAVPLPCPECSKTTVFQRACPAPTRCVVTGQVSEHVHQLCAECDAAWTRAVYRGSLPSVGGASCEECGGGRYVETCPARCAFATTGIVHEHLRCDRCGERNVLNVDCRSEHRGMWLTTA